MVKLVAVLAAIDQAVVDTRPHTFAIGYVKKDGTYGHKHRVRKSGTLKQGTQKSATGHFRYKVKEKGVLMLHDELTNQPFAIKISLITHFNGIRIWH